MTTLSIKVQGINEAVSAVMQMGELTAEGVARGLMAAGLLIQRRAMMKTPVEYGFLRASAFTRIDRDQLEVEVGFSANYAIYVHALTAEKLRGQPRRSGLGTYWNPGESEFLRKARVATTTDEILGLIVKYQRELTRTRSA